MTEAAQLRAGRLLDASLIGLEPGFDLSAGQHILLEAQVGYKAVSYTHLTLPTKRIV